MTYKQQIDQLKAEHPDHVELICTVARLTLAEVDKAISHTSKRRPLSPAKQDAAPAASLEV